jgi:hypothetical protein
MSAGTDPGSGRRTQEERERSSWLVDDEDPWTDDESVAPPVIGDAEQ